VVLNNLHHTREGMHTTTTATAIAKKQKQTESANRPRPALSDCAQKILAWMLSQDCLGTSLAACCDEAAGKTGAAEVCFPSKREKWLQPGRPSLVPLNQRRCSGLRLVFWMQHRWAGMGGPRTCRPEIAQQRSLSASKTFLGVAAQQRCCAVSCRS
jgi:hypothetical protein